MGLYPKALEAALAGIPWGPYANCYIVDTVNGSDSNDGKRWSKPLLTIEAAYALCTTNQNDVIVFVGGPTADNPAATIPWTKSYTHMVGLSSDVYGLGQRCRIVTEAATEASPIMTISGNGCVFKNIQFNNEKAAGAAAGVVAVTGSRNYFDKCFFMAPTASDAGSYSLKMSGSENVFSRCTIGQMTNFRSAASYGLWLHGATAVSRNKFVDCEFLSWGGGSPSTHVHVLVDADIVTTPWWTTFENCLFHNNLSGGTILAQSIDDNCTSTGHQIIFRGDCLSVGATLVGDALSYMWAKNPDASISGLLAVVVNEG